MTGIADIPFVLCGEEKVSSILEETAETFGTLCQIGLKENKRLNVDNIKSFYEETTQNFKADLMQVASVQSKKDILSAFVYEFLITSNEDSGDGSEDNSDSLDDIVPNMNETHNMTKGKDSQGSDFAMSTSVNLKTVHLENKNISWLSIPATAVAQNRLDIIQMCIKTNWDLSLFRDPKDRSLLSIALTLSEPNFDLITLLLIHIDVNLPADKGVTPLHECMSNESLNGNDKFRLMQMLITHGADCKRISQLMGSPLNSYLLALAVLNTKEKIDLARDIIDTLLQNGTDLNGLDWFGQSSLSNFLSVIPTVDEVVVVDSLEDALCVRQMKVDIVQYLLEKGADPNKKDKSGCTSLHAAMLSQNLDVAEIIIRHGADVNALTYTRCTPIYYFCNHLNWEDDDSIQELFIPMIKLLYNSNPDMNIKAIDGSAVLHFAAARLNKTICSFLIELGSKVDVQDYLMRTPLHMASRNKIHPDVCEVLIKAGADINAKDKNKATPLHTACVFENSETMKRLLENKCIVSSPDELGIQSIHLAAENGSEEMLEHLLAYGADVHAEDQWKATPLHYSASDGNSETTGYLLSRGADKSRRDNRGRTPLDLSRFRGRYEVAKLLADNTLDVKFGKFPPHLFPHPKLVKQENVNEYFENIIRQLKGIWPSPSEISEAILSSPGVGRVELNEGENKEIFETVRNLVTDIVSRIGELDPIFKCTLLAAGSTSEGVKIGYPDEYDFVCNLDNFSSQILRIEKDIVPVYAKIFLTTPVPEQYSRFCIRTSGHLNAAEILRYFHCLARRAMFDVLSRGFKSIYAGLLLLHHHELIFNEAAFPLTKLQGFRFSWRGCDHKLLDISVDLNPVVFTDHWPEKFSTESTLLGDISKYGMFLIPKNCNPPVIAFPDQMAATSLDLWRYSTHHIESAVMNNLPQKARECYMLCKAFRMEPLTCAVENAIALSFDSEKQLQLLCSSGSACSEHFENGFKTDEIGAQRGTIEVNLMDEQYDEFEENAFYQDENDFTAETAIPSYYLKTIFLTEAEQLCKTSGGFPGDMLRISRRVYKKLLESVNTEHLAAPFFPSQEIYSNPSHDNPTAAKKIRILFCENILKLITTLEE